MVPAGPDIPRPSAAMPMPESRTSRRTLWFSWLLGIALLTVVAVVATHLSEERAFVGLVERISPGWLVVAIALQLGTYLADANTLRGTLVVAGWPRPLKALVGLSFAKLFMDQAVPSGGFSGTLLIMQSLARRGVPRAITLAAVILDLVAYYAAYLVALVVALVVAATLHDLTPWVLVPAAIFTLIAAAIITGLLVLAYRGYGALPQWLRKRRTLQPVIDDIEHMPRTLFRNPSLFGRCFAFELAIFAFDASTLWTLLYALGEPSPPVLVFAAFMVATLARTMGFVPGGLGTFEAVSVTMLHLMGVPIASALAATLLFRGLSFWLPMVPGILLARRESRQPS
jgi:P-type Mg2+ transporter